MQKTIAKLKESIKGFTLIELLIVIAIIGILSSTAIVSTNMARKKARDARRLTDIQQIANAMEIYLDSNDRKYPDSLEALVPNYIAVLPKDPLTQAGYFYCANGTAGGVNDGTTFHLAAAMEEFNPTFFDKDADLEVDGCENLAGNLSFNGYSEACASTQKCNGENCDGCLDFTNIVTPAFPGGDGGNGGGGDNGGGNGGGNNQCDTLVPNPDQSPQQAGIEWVAREAAGSDHYWVHVSHGDDLFVALGIGNDKIMTSPDGLNWTVRTGTGISNSTWISSTYGNGTYVAVGINSGNRVMTSPDGINWTGRSALGNNDDWRAVTYANGMFVAVGMGGGGNSDMIMTSPDGINWTARSSPGGTADKWMSVTYGNGLFVAAGGHGNGNAIITSTDGINWTVRSAAGNNDTWRYVAYGNNTFVVVGNGPGTDRILTSPDGINWTVRSAAGNNDLWESVAYGGGLFTAVAYDFPAVSDRVITSPDGINWTVRNALGNNDGWRSVAYGNGMFVSVAYSNSLNDVIMTSGRPERIYQACP